MLVLISAALLALTGCRHDGPDREALPTAAQASLLPGDFPGPYALGDGPLTGRFSAQDVALQLHSDGRYVLRAEHGSTAGSSEGLWSLEPGTGQLLLVPHAADEPRRRYSMPSDNELMPEDGGIALHREPAMAVR